MKGCTIHRLTSAVLLTAVASLSAASGFALSTGDTRSAETYPVLVQNDPQSGGLLLKQGTSSAAAAETASETPPPPDRSRSAASAAPPPDSPAFPATPGGFPAPAAVDRAQPSAPVYGAEARQLDDRIASIERLLEQGRQEDRSMIMLMITITLLVSGVTGLTGIGAIIAVVILQARWINRVSESAFAHQSPSVPPALGWAGQGLPEPNRTPASIQTSRQQFSDAVQSLRAQIAAMENGGGGPPRAATGVAGRGAEIPVAESESTGTDEYEVSRLLEKGSQLLDIGRTERALICFDQARVLAPDRVEVHLKRARALEQLQRENEALEAFDEVLTIDPSMVAANLGKANILNRLERYNEALECYEKALGHASTPRRPVV